MRTQKQSNRPSRDWIKKILARHKNKYKLVNAVPNTPNTASKRPDSLSGVPSAPQGADFVVKGLHFISYALHLVICGVFGAGHCLSNQIPIWCV